MEKANTAILVNAKTAKLVKANTAILVKANTAKLVKANTAILLKTTDANREKNYKGGSCTTDFCRLCV